MGRVSKYSQAVGKVIDVVASKANLPTEAEYGQLCLVNDESRSYVYEGSEWIILPELIQDDTLLPVVAALRLKGEKEASVPGTPPETPGSHGNYWIGRRYV
jgi:hypothetical protein